MALASNPSRVTRAPHSLPLAWKRETIAPALQANDLYTSTFGYIEGFLHTVEPRYFELGLFEKPTISNSNGFPCRCFFCHLLSTISNPCYFELFSFPLRVRNCRVQLYFIYWMTAYPVDNSIHTSNNWGQVVKPFLREKCAFFLF